MSTSDTENKTETPENRQNAGQFKKGQSGNPGGRPKENKEVQELARTYTVEAIEKLATWMQSENAKASISACVALLERGWGKPSQAHEISGSVEHTYSVTEAMPFDVIRTRAKERASELKKSH